MYAPVACARWRPVGGCAIKSSARRTSGARLPCRAAFGKPPGMGGGPKDPFSAPRRPPSKEEAPQDLGFVGEPTRHALEVGQLELLPVAEADTILSRFDREQMQSQRETLKPIASAAGPSSTTFSSSNTAGSAACTIPPLRSAAIALASEASNVMLGICASSSDVGLKALKSWTYNLGLPKGLLHGMDNNGVPVPLAGPVFIKYNSISGDANVSGYAGPCRGVVFSPTLVDAVGFRQYAYLPLGLFEVDV
mmetsp:Transcript_13615/g.49493  ORF Transcript_13615/g.49493 Transcript_13615/m.49493 type:complete len:250 (+) Transcript_13615:39-788(+)